ncbi:MAG: hypothetical protein RRC07_18035 [Anaerolineae bacterium]|nr:hypothetical protein [Anaerolineae bacterium]
MRWIGLIVFPFIWLLLARCSNDLGPMAPTPTPTRIVEKPQVISTSPDVIISAWEYLSPQSEEALASFPAHDPDAIEFAPGNRQATIIWREGGFDLVWGGYFCSIQPILTIGDGTIELWENSAIWDDCEAMETIHAFKVEMETDIPATVWRYAIHEGAPADTSHGSGRTVTGQIVQGYGDHSPVARALLQLEPGGEFVAETDTDGAFTLNNVPFAETTVYAGHLHFVIPAGEEAHLDLGTIEYPLVHPPALPLKDYPPGDTPSYVESGDFWLAHHPEGNLLAFVPVSPAYRDDVAVAACRFDWVEALGRFVDPCSGDEWALDGTLNLAHSTERWSNRDLDQYALTVGEATVTVHLDQVITGTADRE